MCGSVGELCEIGYEEPVPKFVVLDRIPHGFSPKMGQQAHFDPPVPKLDMDVDVAPIVPDAQSAPNVVVGDACRTHDVMADPPHEIPLTHNHPSKCLIHIVIGSLPPSLHPFFSFFPHISTYVTGDISDNVDVPPVATQVHCGDGFRGF